MRSDWHRYNLKRKVADLPPVSADDYNQKVLNAQATTTAAKEQASFAKSCSICQKTYYSENAFQNHISSKTHKMKALSASSKPSSVTTTNGETIPAEAEAEFEGVVAGMKNAALVDEAVPRRPSAPPPGVDREEHPLSPEKLTIASSDLPVSRCLFCNYDSPNLKLSVVHMTKIHGLFIPEQSYLTDLEGLIKYLQAKIHENHECIGCHKLKGTTSGVQTHMRDKGHCMIAFEAEEEMIEIGQFYDFSSTYSDDEAEGSDEEMEDGAKVGDDGWETDSDVSSLASDEITSIPNDDRTDAYQRMKLHRHHSNGVERPHRNADGFHSYAHQHNNAVFYDEHEMHLPSGRVAGHRSLKKYFRQNLHNYPSQAERIARAQKLLRDGPPTASDIEDAEDEEMEDAQEETPKSQALLRRGEAGMLGVTDRQKQEVKKAEQRGRTHAQRAQNRYQAKLEKQANSQKHFRDPLLQ